MPHLGGARRGRRTYGHSGAGTVRRARRRRRLGERTDLRQADQESLDRIVGSSRRRRSSAYTEPGAHKAPPACKERRVLADPPAPPDPPAPAASPAPAARPAPPVAPLGYVHLQQRLPV